MVVYSNRHHFLGIFLSDYILVQARLDLMRCRKVMNVNERRCLLAFFFLLHALLLWNLLAHIINI